MCLIVECHIEALDFCPAFIVNVHDRLIFKNEVNHAPRLEVFVGMHACDCAPEMERPV